MHVIGAVVGNAHPESGLDQRKLRGIVLVGRRAVGHSAFAALTHIGREIFRIVRIVLHDMANVFDRGARNVHDIR